MLEESMMTGILVECWEYTSSDLAVVMAYVDLCFSGCALLITVVVSCKQLSNVVLRRFVSLICLHCCRYLLQGGGVMRSVRFVCHLFCHSFVPVCYQIIIIVVVIIIIIIIINELIMVA